MEKFLEKINKLADMVSLSADKKTSMRSNLVRFMDSNQVIAQPAFANIFYQRFVMPTVAFAGLLILVGSGTSVAAENALPGDALYDIKIKLTEPLVGAFNVSTRSKADWETRVAERRLEEANELALAGKLDGEKKDIIAQNFSRFAERAQDKIEMLNKEGDPEAANTISVRFESSLAAHSKILAVLDIKGRGIENASALNDEVAIALNKATQERGSSEAKVQRKGDKLESAAEGKMKAANNMIASTKNFLDRKGLVLTEDSKVAVEAKISTAENLLKEAQVQFEEGKYGESFRLANEAMRSSSETKVLANAQMVADEKVLTESNMDARVASVRVNFLEDGTGSGTMGAATMSISAEGPLSLDASSTASSSVSSSPVVIPNSISQDIILELPSASLEQ